MNQIAENIKQRLSLRKPLQEALDILTELSQTLELKKEVDINVELEKVKAKYPTFKEFERDFTSICFSIATGVGKTRLMGACIAYLYLQKNIRNFFILAPNLTIYNKLIEDFGNSSYHKYVFNGIADFVHNKPVIITGDNYNQQGELFSKAEVRINIFNVSKFARETKPTVQGGRNLAPKIKRLSEYLGQSYWEYLSNLEDLVILMDEAHRYRADVSSKAINELMPILGIELTATPIDNKGNKFNNVVYEYSLAEALKEGLYVKAPAIATRRDFKIDGKQPQEIERIKIDDAINIHEDTKLALEVYCNNENKPMVKPLVLIAAKSTEHAKELYEYINSPHFIDGAYMGKVLQIDSTSKDDDEISQQFISLESAENPIEIVIHVFMLKEGWDVSNLYTICPLNAANSSILIEQTIGRGLRLPFGGQRTGVQKLDILTIVAHDNYDKILEEAKNPSSPLNKIKLIEVAIDPNEPKQTSIVVKDSLTAKIEEERKLVEASTTENKQQQLNQLDAKRLAFHYLPKVAALSDVSKISDARKTNPKNELRKYIETELYSGQPSLFAENILNEFDNNVDDYIKEFEAQTIPIPRMVVESSIFTTRFNDFDLDTSNFNYVKLNEEILRINLTDKKTDVIEVKQISISRSPLEMLMVELYNFPELDYDYADLHAKLCEQAITELEKTITGEHNIKQVVYQWKRTIAEKIYDQIMLPAHFEVIEVDARKPNFSGFQKIIPFTATALTSNGLRDYKDDTMQPSQVKNYLFTGFVKTTHQSYKYANRTEQTFGYILEEDKEVLKWMRPALRQFSIYWNNDSQTYQPDFIAETEDCIYMIETKASNEIDDVDVQAKAKKAIEYCKYATEFTKENGGKQWKYVLIPHDKVAKNGSFKGTVLPYIIN
jgi:type III restriction enzyme